MHYVHTAAIARPVPITLVKTEKEAICLLHCFLPQRINLSINYQ